MPFDPAFAGIAANGITKLVDTDIGDKCVHHVANVTRKGPDDRYDREAGTKAKSSSRSRSRRSRSRQSEDIDDEDEKPWSRKSYWKSSSRQQKSTSEPRRSIEQDSEDEWSRKTYWRRSRHQQQLVPKEEPVREKRMTKEDGEAEQARMERRDRFRNAKSSYLPAERRSADAIPWEANRLYADVGRAVREASRRSGEQIRA